MSSIVVIGGGASGHALAADLAGNEHDVVLCELPQYRHCLAGVQAAGGIRLIGKSRFDFVPLPAVDIALEDAVPRANIIFVAVVANRHEEVARAISPYVTAGQTIVVAPDSCGSLIFARVLKGQGVTIGGMGGNYFACRFVDAVTVRIGLPPRRKKIAAFPASETPELLESLAGVLDCDAGQNVLALSLSSPNIPNHLAGTILNMGAMEKSPQTFNLFRHGLSKSVVRCIEAVGEERDCVLEALGYEPVKSDLLRKIADLDHHPELDEFRNLDGPSGMDHRYISEDAEIGIALLISVGKALGVPTPLAAALLTIASITNGTDYYSHGRTLERLGLANMTAAALDSYLATGKHA
jgi:opine dehydrogenase